MKQWRSFPLCWNDLCQLICSQTDAMAFVGIKILKKIFTLASSRNCCVIVMQCIYTFLTHVFACHAVFFGRTCKPNIFTIHSLISSKVHWFTFWIKKTKESVGIERWETLQNVIFLESIMGYKYILHRRAHLFYRRTLLRLSIL